MEERQQRVSSYCSSAIKKEPMLLTQASTEGMILTLKERALIWCLVKKSASTRWNFNIAKLSRRNFSEQESRLLIMERAQLVTESVKDPKSLHKVFSSDSNVAFVIVRHPLDRIVSAFRDRLEKSHPRTPNYAEISRRIASKWRAKAIQTLGREFFDGPLDGASLPVHPPGRRLKEDNLASFWEFVQELVHTSPLTYNVHWKPIYMFCNMCHQDVRYDFILRLESLKNEEKAFVRHMDWTDELGDDLDIRHANKYLDMTQSEITRHYFKNISLSDILKLDQIYKHDFEMFGYKNFVLPEDTPYY